MDRTQKEAAVTELTEGLKGAEAVFAVDYRGISVTDSAELRGKLAEADAVFKVVKNRLAKRAAADAGTEGIDHLLVGPTALTLIKGDAVIAAKAIADFAKEHDELEYKGGFMDGAALDPEGFMVIARLPGRDILYGQLVGLAASPLTGLAAGMNNLISGLGRQLAQIAEQGLVTGEAPETAPPAEETAPPAEHAEEEAQPEEPKTAPAEEPPGEETSEEPEAQASEETDETEDASDGEPEAPAAEPETESEEEASEEVEADGAETAEDDEEA